MLNTPVFMCMFVCYEMGRDQTLPSPDWLYLQELFAFLWVCLLLDMFKIHQSWGCCFVLGRCVRIHRTLAPLSTCTAASVAQWARRSVLRLFAPLWPVQGRALGLLFDALSPTTRSMRIPPVTPVFNAGGGHASWTAITTGENWRPFAGERTAT